MNATQVGGIVRGVLNWLCGIIVAKGFLPGGQWIEIVAGVGGAIGIGLWSVYSNKITTMIDQITKSADVHEVIVEPHIAEEVVNGKVVARP